MATITFELNTGGQPIVWFQDDKPLETEARIETVSEGLQHSLVIHGVDVNESAVYSIQIGASKHVVAQLIVEGLLPSFLSFILANS